jgi:hypothetical protein
MKTSKFLRLTTMDGLPILIHADCVEALIPDPETTADDVIVGVNTVGGDIHYVAGLTVDQIELMIMAAQG